MSEHSSIDQDKFDAILRRLIKAKPQTGEETKAKAKTQRAAKKAVRTLKAKSPLSGKGK